jgi:hypothetical protein
MPAPALQFDFRARSYGARLSWNTPIAFSNERFIGQDLNNIFGAVYQITNLYTGMPWDNILQPKPWPAYHSITLLYPELWTARDAEVNGIYTRNLDRRNRQRGIRVPRGAATGPMEQQPPIRFDSIAVPHLGTVYWHLLDRRCQFVNRLLVGSILNALGWVMTDGSEWSGIFAPRHEGPAYTMSPAVLEASEAWVREAYLQEAARMPRP